jgi:hypothetical protein
MRIDANPDSVPDPAYHFDADPDPKHWLYISACTENAFRRRPSSYLEQVHSLGVHLRYEGVEGAGLAGRERLPQDAGAAGPVRRARRPQQLEDVVQLVRLRE